MNTMLVITDVKVPLSAALQAHVKKPNTQRETGTQWTVRGRSLLTNHNNRNSVKINFILKIVFSVSNDLDSVLVLDRMTF